ncbi:Rhs family protein [Candidatus Paraburkholderia calva]|nr:Rhs family protein [Candidatus Paraburkholderia calva]
MAQHKQRKQRKQSIEDQTNRSFLPYRPIRRALRVDRVGCLSTLAPLFCTAWGAAPRRPVEYAAHQPLRFQGQYADGETALIQHNQHRYYDPSIGRFITLDPIGLPAGSNRHRYAPNPCRWIDPLGIYRESI